MKSVTLIAIAAFVVLSGCSHSTSVEKNPDWVDRLVTKYANEPVGNPPQSIWRYEYKGQTVYYIPPQCCDQYSILYDERSAILCAPDGGITGRGDGRCSDFFTERKNEKLIWQDTRRR